MSEGSRKISSRTFKKRAHRPWKTALLENAVQEANTDSADIFFDIDIDSEPTTDINSFYPEFNFTDDLPKTAASLDFDLGFDLDAEVQTNTEAANLKQEIRQTKEQKRLLLEQISDRSGSQVLLGGFFQPQQITAKDDNQSSKRINSLLSDLKAREQKLSTLTSNLRISEAYERAAQAEVSKQASSQQLQIVETRLRQAIEQARIAEEQFVAAMDQAKQAALAQQEESQLRRKAETIAKESMLKTNNAEIELQNERLARLSAEEKAQHAYQLAEKATQFQRQLNEATEKLSKLEENKNSAEQQRAIIQKQFEDLNGNFIKIDQEHRQCTNEIYKLEEKIKDLTQKNTSQEQIVNDFNAQRDKLKAIIASEQDLRKIAERKLNDAMERATKAEQGWQKEVQQRKIIEERAKRAVAHASRTVMHLLNAPADNEFQMQATSLQDPPLSKDKIKVKVTPTSNISEEYDYEEDDLRF